MTDHIRRLNMSLICILLWNLPWNVTSFITVKLSRRTRALPPSLIDSEYSSCDQITNTKCSKKLDRFTDEDIHFFVVKLCSFLKIFSMHKPDISIVVTGWHLSPLSKRFEPTTKKWMGSTFNDVTQFFVWWLSNNMDSLNNTWMRQTYNNITFLIFFTWTTSETKSVAERFHDSVS